MDRHPPQFSTAVYTNSSGFNSRVPTGNYKVEAIYDHWRNTETATVTMDGMTSKSFAPRFGSVSITGSHLNTRFELRDFDGMLMASGELPTIITGLPEGSRYKLTTQRNAEQKSQAVTVGYGTTNTIQVEYSYGSVAIDSKPAGASVYHLGEKIGVTPLTVNEVSAGSYEFSLTRANYESVTAEVVVLVHQTNTFSTNLINEHYTQSMTAARQAFAKENFARSSEALKDALKELPNDPEAVALLKQTDEKLAAAKTAAAAQEAAERERQAQARRPGKAFSALCEQTTNANLFSEFLIKTYMPAQSTKNAIVQALQVSPLGFEIVSDTVADTETYAVVAKQTFSLGFLGGTQRDCLIVVGKTTDSETEIYYKVLEYTVQSETVDGQSTKVLVPLHSSRIQMSGILNTTVKNGIELVRERIFKALR